MPLPDIDPASISIAEIPATVAMLSALQGQLIARLLTTNDAHDSHAANVTTPEKLLTVPEVAEVLGFARGYVYELIRNGQIAAIRTGKYVRIPAGRKLSSS